MNVEKNIANGWKKNSDNDYAITVKYDAVGNTATHNLFNSMLCDCPNGTMHEPGETCCVDRIDCACEMIYKYVQIKSVEVDYSVPVLQDSADITSVQMDAAVTNICAGAAALDDANKKKLEGKIKEIRVVESNGKNSCVFHANKEGYVITFKSGLEASVYRGLFELWIGITLLSGRKGD